MSLPNKKYSVIYCDPPWKYKRMVWNEGAPGSGSAELHYNTMTLEELKALDVKSIAAKKCCLFMWTSGPQVDVAVELGTSWGFKFKTVAFVWEKQRPMCGHYTMSTCEYVLVFTRGSIPKPRDSRNQRQFLSQKRTDRHSEKPHEIRERIDKIFSSEHHEKIELFARHITPGWDVWGNDPALVV